MLFRIFHIQHLYPGGWTAITNRPSITGSPSLIALSLPRFELGQLVVTAGAAVALRRAGQSPWEFVTRHAAGDWGEVSDHDWHTNDLAVVAGDRVLSAYTTSEGQRIWVITESGGYSTCILVPAEY